MKTRHLILCIALALGFISSVASADPSPAEYKRARALYREGTRQFKIGSYERARDAYLSAFDLVPISEFLFNAAQAQRRLGDTIGALQSYRRYLELEPAGEASEVARTYIASAEAPGPEPARARAQVTPAPTAESENAVEQARARALQQEREGFVPAPVAAQEQPSEPKPIYQRWWLWTAVGGVAVAGLAIGLGVGLTRPHPAEFSPSLPTFGSTAMTAAALRF